MSDHTILVTGCAGFIGSYISAALLKSGQQVVGVDSINDYYDPRLKRARLSKLRFDSNFQFFELDVSNKTELRQLFLSRNVTQVVHLAAQAGVRYSIINPEAYSRANIDGFLSVISLCAEFKVQHLVYASSSSVYGANTKVPFHEDDPVNSPVSYYAATKRSNELTAQVFSGQYQLACTGLRFFTVYGPFGRPDMAYWSFTENIVANRVISVFGKGLLARDFTYVDDVVSSIERVLQLPPAENVPHRILNVGNSSPHTVNDLIRAIEIATGKTALREDRPQPLGDVEKTFCDSTRLSDLTGFSPRTDLQTGINKFVAWYENFKLENH